MWIDACTVILQLQFDLCGTEPCENQIWTPAGKSGHPWPQKLIIQRHEKNFERYLASCHVVSKVLTRPRHSAGVEHGWADDLKIWTGSFWWCARDLYIYLYSGTSLPDGGIGLQKTKIIKKWEKTEICNLFPPGSRIETSARDPVAWLEACLGIYFLKRLWKI